MKYSLLVAALSLATAAPISSASNDLQPLIYVQKDGSLWIGPDAKTKLMNTDASAALQQIASTSVAADGMSCIGSISKRNAMQHKIHFCCGSDDHCDPCDPCCDPCDPCCNPCDSCDSSCDPCDPCDPCCSDSSCEPCCPEPCCPEPCFPKPCCCPPCSKVCSPCDIVNGLKSYCPTNFLCCAGSKICPCNWCCGSSDSVDCPCEPCTSDCGDSCSAPCASEHSCDDSCCHSYSSC